jgi:DNA-directed RNA polymerase subunit RPC12/RpoP
MLFRNYYTCVRCGHEWSDVWSAQCDDDCPGCGARHMSPSHSEDVIDVDRARRIAELNDAFRNTLSGGQVLISANVGGLPAPLLASAIRQMIEFGDFTPDNDPYGEHDFGCFELGACKFMWKIDYYDQRCEFGSEDPSDPRRTTRVLTLMLASEY